MSENLFVEVQNMKSLQASNSYHRESHTFISVVVTNSPKGAFHDRALTFHVYPHSKCDFGVKGIVWIIKGYEVLVFTQCITYRRWRLVRHLFVIVLLWEAKQC